MNDGILRRVAWRQICPWLLLFQTPRLALRLPILALAFAAVMLTPLGWWISAALFVGPNEPDMAMHSLANSAWPGADAGGIAAGGFDRAYKTTLTYGPSALHAKMAAWQRILLAPSSATSAAYLLFGYLWTLFVWSFFGTAISRIAVAHFGCGEQIGIGQAMRFARGRFRSVVSAPLIPTAALVFLLLIPGALGWLMSFEGFAAIFASILWGGALLAGVFATLLAVGIFFGWPLMIPTIATERNGDAFEALANSFAYCTQRPLHLFLYAALASLLGGATWVAVDGFLGFLLHSTMLAATVFGAEAANFRIASSQGAILKFWTVLAQGFAAGFHFSFFWSASSAIYLLLRRDLDQTDFDDVHLERDGEPMPMPTISPTPPADDIGPEAKTPSESNAESNDGESADENGNDATANNQTPEA